MRVLFLAGTLNVCTLAVIESLTPFTINTVHHQLDTIGTSKVIIPVWRIRVSLRIHSDFDITQLVLIVHFPFCEHSVTVSFVKRWIIFLPAQSPQRSNKNKSSTFLKLIIVPSSGHIYKISSKYNRSCWNSLFTSHLPSYAARCHPRHNDVISLVYLLTSAER